MYVLLTTGHFDRRVVKVTRAHSDLKKPLAKALKTSKPIPFCRPFDCIHSAENSQDAEKVRQLCSRIAQRLSENFSEIGNTGGAYPVVKIHSMGERPHEVWYVPPRLFACCGRAGRPF